VNTDLTSPAARVDRDQFATRIEVLDKVGVLRTLQDDVHVTTEMISEFYGVEPDAIRWHVKNNRDELDDDGYRTITRSVFEREFGSLSNLDPRARQIALFPRRAVLRIGMLLRDSITARAIRNYLLDTERQAVAESEDEIVLRALQIQTRKIAALTERVAELEPKANYVDVFVADSDLLSIRTIASTLGVQEKWLRDELVHRKWIYAEIASRWSGSKGLKINVTRYSEYSDKKAYFQRVENHDAPRFRGEVMHTLKVTAAGANAIARMVPRWSESEGDAA
jgi:hypothetical protein